MATNLPTSEVVHLDLDTLRRPEDERREPFRFSFQGRTIEMKDPADMDWRDVIRLSNPAQLFNLCLATEDRRFFLQQEMDSWRLGKLVEAFNDHYGLEEELRKARRQQQLASIGD